MNYGNIFCHLAVIFICTSSSVTVKIALTDEEMDNFYTKCLNLSNGQQNFDENIDKKQLQQRLTASNFYKDLLQLIRPILMLKNDKILSKFEKFSKFVEGIDKISHLNNCKIWLLRWEIINFSVENHLIPLPWDEATHMAKMLMIRQANCAEIGTFLEQNEGNQIENPPPDVADFLTEVTATHFTVFVTDLLPNFNCDFLQFFDAKKMEKETNFAHQMRMLRLENPANNGKIAEIKKEIEQQFVGPNLMRQIEFKFPIYMAIDIIDDIKLGMHYAELLSRDEETRNNAELLLSNRIFSARIWTIFFNTYLLTKRRHISHNAKKKDAKTRQILAQIQTIWRHGLQERRGMQNILPNNTTNDNLNASLAPLHDQWLQLANLYNQMPLVARDERVQIAQPQHQHVRHQLSDEHAENMIRLASTKNAFSDCLQNSLFEGKGTKIRARWFFTFNSEETMGFYDAFVSKYPQIETLTRTELTDDEITQLQIQTYIKFFDRNNNEQIWRRAQFLLNVLAFYQWLKNQMNSLPDVKKIRINMHMELLELFMDSASEVPIDQLKNEDYEINFTKHFNEIRAEVLPKLIPKCDGTSIEAVLAQRNLHDEVLTKLLLNNEFVKQLKTICVDVNRLRQICNDQTRIATQIVTQNCPEQSHGPQIGQENENALNASSDTVFCDDDELSKLARLYQNVMAQQNSVPSDSLNFETAYFYHKTVVKELMDYIGLVQRLFKFDNSNKNVKRMIIQLNVEVAKCDLFANVTDRAQKMENLCLMDSLLAHLLNNGTMFTAIGQWQSFLTEKQFYNNSAVPRPSDADRHWTKPECHKAEVVDSTQHKLFNTPQLITWHTGVVLGHLVQKCPSFVQFVNKIVPKVASISNYGQLYANERILLYKTILGSTDTEAIKVAEGLLAIKFFFAEINEMEEANFGAEKFGQIANGRAELFGTFRMLQIILGETKSIFWMFCPLINYLSFLRVKVERPTTFWHNKQQLNCYKTTIVEHFELQRKALGQIHMAFFTQFLIKNANENDLVKIVRESPGAILRLRNLLDTKIDNFMLNENNVRQRLINWNFFHDKTRLLAHYYANLVSNDAAGAHERWKHRMAADITVWMCRFEQLVQQQQLEAVRHEMETKWLFFRSAYDIFWDVQPPFAEHETEQKLACAINNFILKIEKFVTSHNKVPSDEKKTLADWHELKYSTFGDSKLDEIDENNKIGDENCVEPVELVQKLHFEEFRKFSLSKIEENATKWAQIVDVLSTKNESKRNILQLLKFGDVKILYKMLGIVLKTEDFADCANIECANSEKIIANLVESPEDQPNLNCEKEKDEEIIEKVENIEEICLSSIKLSNDLPQIEMLEEKGENEKEISKKKDTKIVENNNNEKRKQSLAKEWTRIGPLNLKAFCEDAFLYSKYAEFVSAPSDGLLVLLDIGAYANEIGQRIQMVEELQKIDNKLVPNLCHVEIKPIKDEWAQLLETEYDNVDVVPALEWKLHQILWKILNVHQNSEAVVENGDNEMRNVKAQMHLRKFAMALLADQTTKFGDLWTKIEQKKRQKLLQNISGMRCGHIRFDHLKLRWQKMDAQIQMDQLLFNKLPESEQKSNKNLCPIFPKLSQQLNFVENIKNETKMSQNLDNYLDEIVYKNAAEFDEKIKKSLQKINAIFEAWSEGHDVQLLITGSFLLDTHTIHSDVDLLCIVPGKVIKKVQFFGTDTTQCQQPDRVCSDGTNSSLYCQLCQHELVTDLRKFANGPVLMIKFMFDQIPYDVTLVQIPDRKTLPPKMDDQTLEDLMAKFKKPTEINTKMLRVLSSHRSTLFIDNLILDGQNNGDWKQILLTDISLAQQKKDKTFNKNAKNFHMLILMLKLWAKNNYIYSTKYGYLNGTILTIMVTKIVLLYPNASVPFLIEKFFVIYSTRPMVLPVQLNELNESSGTVNPFFVRNPVEQEMPVYTPIFPEQNAASLVTHCGASVIRKAMINALTQIKSADEAKLFEWNKLFNKSIDFVEKYEYFVLINCVGEEQFGLDKFCQFVDGRIRRQIVYDLDPKNGPNIGTHLFPDIYWHKNCAISNKFLIFPFRLNFCTVWLLGINARVNKAQMVPLLAQFDGTIKRHYLKYNPTQNNESAGGGGGGKNKRHKEFKMPQIEDIEATFGQSKLALKSILVNKWEMFEMLESEEKE